MREFYEHSYANVHRGVYTLAERATAGYEGAREKVRAYINAPSNREVIFTRSATEALNLIAYAWGLENLGPRRRRRDHRARASRELRALAVHREEDRRAVRAHPDRRLRRAAARRARRDRDARQREGRREQPRLEHARDDQPRREARGVGARAGRDHGRRRRAGGAAPAHRRAGARLRLPRVLVAQAVRADRRRRALGPPRAARGDAAVQPGRRDDPLGRARPHELERAAVQVRGGTPAIAEAYGFGIAIDYVSEIGLDGDRSARARARRQRDGEARRDPGRAHLRPARRPPHRDRQLRARERPPARRRADPQLGRRRRARRPPLHAAADDAPRRRGDDARELLPVLGPRGRRPADRRAAQGEETPSQ